MSDSVAVDAKRILLRYGAPINVLDGVSDEDRIALARAIAKTNLADRETRLKELLDAPDEEGKPYFGARRYGSSDSRGASLGA